MLGYVRDEFLGKKLWEIGAFKDTRASRAAFAELQSKGYVRYEDLPLTTKDGREIPVEFVSNVYSVDHHKVIQCNIRDITERKKAEEERERLILELRDALSKVKILSGLLPICASCKNIRNDEGYWEQVEVYIAAHSGRHSPIAFARIVSKNCIRNAMTRNEMMTIWWCIRRWRQAYWHLP